MILVPIRTYIIENPEMARPLQKLIWEATEARLIQTIGEVTEDDIGIAINEPNCYFKVGVEIEKPYHPVVGVVGLQKFNPIDGVGETCVCVEKSMRRQGYAEKLLVLLRKWAVSTLNLRKITNYICEDSPSLGLDVKMGYTLEGVLKNHRYKNGRYIDVHIYSWLREGN